MIDSPLHLLATTAPSHTASGLGGVFDRLNILDDPAQLLERLSAMPFIGASVVVVVGVLCVFHGYRWHKWVIAILAFLAGLGIGHQLAGEVGRSTIVAVAVGCLCAIIATPLLRITVGIFGGITGAFIGTNTWTAMNASPPEAHWAGAVIGFIIIAMISIVLFRLVVVLFTSIGGAAMVVFGGITLLMHVPNWRDAVIESLTANTTIIPLLLLLAAVSGFVIQEHQLRNDGVSILGAEKKAASK